MASRSTHESHLKDVIEKLLNTYKLKGKVQEAHIIQAWSRIVGPMIDKHTRDVSLKNGKLYVKLDSAPLRQELMYARTRLAERVNEEVGATAVREVVFV